MDRLAPNVLRVVVMNVGRFPLDVQESKNKAVFNFIKEHKVDVISFTECNVHWKGVPTADRLEERTRGWFEALHMSTAYFKKWGEGQVSPKEQYGEVSLWSINKAAHRVTSKGEDPLGLGRWTWTRYQGRGVTL